MGSDLHHATNRVTNRLRLRQVTLLLAIEQHGTLRHAAQDLGLSQPAATKMLQELEFALGKTLYSRNKKGLVLNASGELVLRSFREVRSTVSALMHRLDNQEPNSEPSTFRIAHTDSETSALVAHAIRDLQRSDRQLRVQCQHQYEASAFASLAQGEVDCVIGTEPVGRACDAPSQLHFTQVAQAGFTVLAATSHPLARIESTRSAPLAWARALRWPWVTPSRDHPAYAFLQACLDQDQLQMPNGSMEMSTLMAATQIACQGDALVLWPSQVLRQNSLVSHWIQWPLQPVLPRAWGVWTRETTQLGSRADYFVQVLRDLALSEREGVIPTLAIHPLASKPAVGTRCMTQARSTRSVVELHPR